LAKKDDLTPLVAGAVLQATPVAGWLQRRTIARVQRV
jgi:hypothetical protein